MSKVSRFNKAIIGLLAPVLVYFAAKAGIDLSVEDSVVVAGIVTSALVALVPNTA